MLIQRRPPASISSTFGVSGASGGPTEGPRPRAPRRRRGRFGIGTSRLVGQGHVQASIRLQESVSLPKYIAGHIQRGGGTGPTKPRQPPAYRHAGKVPIPVRCGGRLAVRSSPPDGGGSHV